MPTSRADEERPDEGAGHIVDTIQTVLTGLVLALIFQSFLVEQFFIPTGSMAQTLLGAHATCTCPACGCEFDFAPLRNGPPLASDFAYPPEVMCPNCQLRMTVTPKDAPSKGGDRILVHKWPYALGGPFRPQRWDVIVFRDPANPRQHYIKRVVGLPHESIELVDGDVFIDGHIARKPPHVQRTMWFPVFDQDHLPPADNSSGRQPRWIAPDPPGEHDERWFGMQTRVVRYDGLDSTPRTLAFNPDTGPEYLRDVYAYNRGSSHTFVGDVRIVSELTLRDGDGWCRWVLTRPPHRLYAQVSADGNLKLVLTPHADVGAERILDECKIAPLPRNRPIAVEFAHVDWRAILKIDGREVLTTAATDYGPDLVALRASPRHRPIGVGVVACNLQLELRGLRVDRDVHYTCHPDRARRAFSGRPFELLGDEYFVLGDNSPDSHDSREWYKAGPHLPEDYRIGTVRADQIVGQAAFVYLPGLLSRDIGTRWSIPDVGRVRFVR